MAMAKWMQCKADDDLHADYQEEAHLQSLETHKTVSLTDVMLAELESGRRRFKNKRKTQAARRG